MDPTDRTQATRTLARARAGEPAAGAALLPLVYGELRVLAGRYLRDERRGHTLQPTALVHEAFLRLFDDRAAQALDRSHFLGVAAAAMRRILVEHARARAALKREAQGRRVTLASILHASESKAIDVLELEEALARLAVLDERLARVVELRFFGGLSMAEVADVLGVSKRSAESDWTLARAFLHRELSADQDPDDIPSTDGT